MSAPQSGQLETKEAANEDASDVSERLLPDIAVGHERRVFGEHAGEDLGAVREVQPEM